VLRALDYTPAIRPKADQPDRLEATRRGQLEQKPVKARPTRRSRL
jgi:ATP-dependent RNA helicase SUPV3L1/SUV3